MRNGEKRKRKLFGFGAALIVAAALWLPSKADAHYVASYEAAAALVNSHYGGRCGDGPFNSCSWLNGAGCYYGGDGACRVGAHSLQLQGSFAELQYQIEHRTCSGVYRMYHLEFGETYWENCY